MSDIDALKLQVKVLQDQVARLTDQVKTLESNQRADSLRLLEVERTTKSNDQYISGRLQYNNGR